MAEVVAVVVVAVADVFHLQVVCGTSLDVDIAAVAAADVVGKENAAWS